jgi:hypothetical protein
MKQNIKYADIFMGRIGLWLRFLKSFSGLTLRSYLNLLFSAVVDILKVLLFPRFILWNPRILWSGLYVIKQDTPIIIFARGGTDDLFYCLPEREPPVASMLSTLKTGDIFVDIGANIGYYTILGAKLGAYVIAVEPVPETMKVINAKFET